MNNINNTYGDNQQILDDLIYDAIQEDKFGAIVDGTCYSYLEEYGNMYYANKKDIEFDGFDSFPVSKQIPDGVYSLHPQDMTTANKITSIDGNDVEFELRFIINGAEVYTDKDGQKMVLPIGKFVGVE